MPLSYIVKKESVSWGCWMNSRKKKCLTVVWVWRQIFSRILFNPMHMCSMKRLRVLLLPQDGMVVHHRVTPSGMSLVAIYTPGWGKTMWGKVSCLRKQYNGRAWTSNHQLSELKSNALTTTPPRPCWGNSEHLACNILTWDTGCVSPAELL